MSPFARRPEPYDLLSAASSAPPPAPSLQPVAMSALGTGGHPAQPERRSLLRARPSLATGAALLFLGALLGGAAGVAYRMPLAAPAAAATAPSLAVELEPERPYANVPFGSLVVSTPEPAAKAAAEVEVASVTVELAAPAGTTPQKQAVALAPRGAKTAKAPAPKKAAPAPAPKPAVVAAPAPKPAPAPKAAVVAAPAPKPAAPAPRSIVNEDPARTLRAAKGATENTL